MVTHRKKDALPTVFFLGLSLGFFILLFMILFTPVNGDQFEFAELYPSLPAFRFSLIIILVFLSCGVIISIYRRYRVNYVMIFNLDIHMRVREAELLKIFTILFSIWLFCGLGDVSILKLDLLEGANISIFGFGLFIALLILWVNPF